MRRNRNRSGHASTLFFLAFTGILAGLLLSAAVGLPPGNVGRIVLLTIAGIFIAPLALFAIFGVGMWVIGGGFLGGWWLLAKLRFVKRGPFDPLTPEYARTTVKALEQESQRIAQESWDRIQSNQANRRH